MFKKPSILLLLMSGCVVLAGCNSQTGIGALAGGAGGAAIGGIAGGGQGALIGGAVGVIGGGLIGAYLDDQAQKKLKQESLQTYQRLEQGEKLSVNDIINLSHAKIDDDKIIAFIQKTGSKYILNNFQIEKLRIANVSDKVINYMIST